MNTREKRLLIGLIALLLGGIAYLGFDRLNAWKHQLDVESRKLDATKDAAAKMLAEENLWKERSSWLAQSEPAFGNRKDAELALVNLIQESMNKFGVSLVKNQPSEPVDLGDMIAVTAIVDCKADLEKALDWLHDLQKPSAFLSIPGLRVMADQEDTSKVLITINLQKWFRKAQS